MLQVIVILCAIVYLLGAGMAISALGVRPLWRLEPVALAIFGIILMIVSGFAAASLLNVMLP